MIGEKIKELRKLNGISQENLAESLGVSRQSISKWELNEANPDINYILAMSKIFNVSTDYILDSEFSKKTENTVDNKDANINISFNNQGANTLSYFGKLVKKYNYILGIIISGYGLAMVVFGQIASYISNSMLKAQLGDIMLDDDILYTYVDKTEIFGVNHFFNPVATFGNIISVIGVIAIIIGIIIAIVLKKKI